MYVSIKINLGKLSDILDFSLFLEVALAMDIQGYLRYLRFNQN